VRYGGAAYAPYSVHTSAAFVAGIGSTFPLKRHLNLTGALTSFTYGLRVRDSAGVDMEGGRQVDLRFQTGLTWTW
jgi:hypothetical protein